MVNGPLFCSLMVNGQDGQGVWNKLTTLAEQQSSRAQKCAECEPRMQTRMDVKCELRTIIEDSVECRVCTLSSLHFQSFPYSFFDSSKYSRED